MQPTHTTVSATPLAKSGKNPWWQFTIAQLLAIAFGIGVLLAAGRVVSMIDDARPLDWIVVIAGFVAATIALFAAGMRRLGEMNITPTLLFALLAIISPALGTSKHAQEVMICSGKLKSIVVALHHYHGEYGSFPPAVVRDERGRPMHSWRVLLLPYLEQGNVYNHYRFDEPWDGPNNRKLHDVEMREYICGSVPGRKNRRPITSTGYVVVVGPRTAFPENRCVALSDITDDHGQTILVVEVHNSGIHWMEPRDLHITQMARQINPAKGQGISSGHKGGGAHVVMADGSVRFLQPDYKLTPQEIESLLTIDGNEPLPQGWPH